MKKKNIHRKRNIAILKDGTKMHYYDYIKSSYWEDVKSRYRKSKLPQNCSRCGRNNRIVFHHVTYKRLGHEWLQDLLPVCWDCHNKIHDDFQVCHDKWNSNWEGVALTKSLRKQKRYQKPHLRNWKRNKKKASILRSKILI